MNDKCYFSYSVSREFLCLKKRKKRKKKGVIRLFSGEIHAYEWFERTVYPQGQFNIPVNLDLRLFPLCTTNTAFPKTPEL